MMIKKFLPLLLVVLWMGMGQAQSKTQKPSDLVNHARKIGMDFQNINLFTLDTQSKSIDIDEKIQDYNLLDIDGNLLSNLRRDQPASISLRIPVQFTTPLELELVRVDIFSSDFNVLRRSDNAVAKVDAGLHYRGIIRGDESAIAAISISEKEVMGLVSWNGRNVVLGRLQENNARDKHIVYDDEAVFLDGEFECSTENDGIGYKRKDLEYDPDGRSVGDCIRLYIEVDYDIHNSKGGVAGATSYVTGLLNQVITIYANESISSVVSELVIWDVPSPYSSSSSSGMLNDFKANISSINGDLGQLLSYQASGGIAAGFSGICNPNVDNSLSFSSIQSSYANVPTYSWSVMVVTHEFGHLWGSRHTHACVWNGNNTAIDGCAGQTEGSCGLPGVPSQGGTIMSYCHIQSVGINFNQGFGQQPGNVIRNSVANASCTSPCGTPSCSDGIQNGQETGVDCGGPDCLACPTCDDGIQNGGETGIDCGGPDCTACPTCDDGIQNGGETGIDCGGPDCPVCPTCDDGIQNGQEAGIDCGGPDCPDCPTCNDGIQNGQETGVDCGGPDCLECSDECTDNLVQIRIALDNFPEETSWDIRSGSTLIASGGPYGNVPDRDTIREEICLPNGCYDFTIYDSYGDGICCGYGQGEYSLILLSDSTILATGASFGSLETNNICLGGEPTCEDGIQNGDETDVDCGGSCAPCETACTDININGNDFESSYGIWNDGGSDCRRVANDAAYANSGIYCVRLRDNSNSSVLTTDLLNLSSLEELTVSFSYYARSMDNSDEDFWLQVSQDGGATYTTVRQWRRDVEFQNNERKFENVVIPGPFSQSVRIRFRCDASSNSDYVYLDDIILAGCQSSNRIGEGLVVIDQSFNEGARTTEPLSEGSKISLYPNPTHGLLNVSIRGNKSDETQFIITDLAGRVIQRSVNEIEAGNSLQEFNLNHLNSGIYILHVVRTDERSTHRFVLMP